jgi:hypothetical protein
MNLKLAIRMRRLIIVGLWLLAGCTISQETRYSIEVFRMPGNTPFIGGEFLVGDTLRLVAAQSAEQFFGTDYSFRSDANSSAFTWSSAAPAIAELVAPGLYVMKGPGEVSLTVSTAHAEANRPILVRSKP